MGTEGIVVPVVQSVPDALHQGVVEPEVMGHRQAHGQHLLRLEEVAEVGPGYFKVSVIPHTGEETTLLSRRPGDVVNLENDVVGKYVERLLTFDSGEERSSGQESSGKKRGIDLNMLSENGFL